MKRLLVTGASGFLGWHLCQRAQGDWQVYGIGRSRPVQAAGVTAIACDLTDGDAVRAVFAEVRPDAVIHAAAQANPNICQQQPATAYAINVTASGVMAQLCAEAMIPFVFTSTDLVFDGTKAPYRETDPVAPVNRYGEQKVAAEKLILSLYPSAAVCRMPLMFGVSPGASSFIQPFAQILRSHQPLALFTDEFRTPVSGPTAAQGLLLAVERAEGILHLGGAERISRYGFGQLMVEMLDLPGDTLTGCRQGDVPMPAPRPADVSLDSSRAFSLGYQPPSLRDELNALRGLL
ncbi:MAG TPA: NAD(P)-dependent oxidoreductase [Chroococcidiopsis sp.]